MFRYFEKIKFILIVFSFIASLLFQNAGFAYGYLPGSGDGIHTFGIGVYLAPQHIKIYSDYEDESTLLVEAKWNELDFDCSPQSLGVKSLFLSYKPEKKMALMIVTDETEEAFEVVYNLSNGAKGWIKKDTQDKFYTWKNFMDLYGKKNGIYIFSGTPAGLKQVRMSPDDKGQPLKTNYYWAKDISLFNIRGNWMLIKIVDFNRETPVGWIRWRSDDGRINVFPQLN